LALPLPVAPMAPDPPVPVVSTPANVTTVIEAATLCERVALTDAPLRVVVLNARQISAVPNWVLVRRTSVQVRVPPVALATALTVTPAVLASVAMNASSNSFAFVVVNVGEVMVVDDVLRSVETVWSMVNCAVEVKFAVALAPLTVTAWLAGVKMYPEWPGVTVYEPFARLLKV